VLGGMVEVVWDDCVCECWFSVYGYFPGCVGSVDDGDVQEEFWMYCVEVFHYALDVCVICVVYDQYVVYIPKALYNLHQAYSIVILCIILQIFN